jgi:hypothetical protein
MAFQCLDVLLLIVTSMKKPAAGFPAAGCKYQDESNQTIKFRPNVKNAQKPVLSLNANHGSKDCTRGHNV